MRTYIKHNKYGLELEFFVTHKGRFIPAHEVTVNLDGNSSIGELKTGICDSMSRAVFELKERIFNEQELLEKQKCRLVISPLILVDDSFIKRARSHKNFASRKERLEEFSIYNQGTSRVLERGELSASLQINLSVNSSRGIQYQDKSGEQRDFVVKNSEVFNFYPIVKTLDDEFATEIEAAKRTKGVFSIKGGELGDRVEYRSLPNNINLEKLIRLFNK